MNPAFHAAEDAHFAALEDAYMSDDDTEIDENDRADFERDLRGDR